MTRVLIATADRGLAEMLSREIAQLGHELITTTTRKLMQDVLQSDRSVVLVSDYLEAILVAASTASQSVFVSASAIQARLALNHGASTVLVMPFTPESLGRALRELSGTRGMIHQLSLLDLLQVMHMGMRSLTISVSPGRGRIYMERGQIVHAECGALSGIDALRVLLSREHSSIGTGPASASRPSIDAPFEVLLLDLMREIDEANRRGIRIGPDTIDEPVVDARPPPLPAPRTMPALAVDHTESIGDLALDLPRASKRLWVVAAIAVSAAAGAASIALQPEEESIAPKPAPPPAPVVAMVKAEEPAQKATPIETPTKRQPKKKRRMRVDPPPVSEPPPTEPPAAVEPPPPPPPAETAPPPPPPVAPPPPTVVVVAPPPPPPPRSFDRVERDATYRAAYRLVSSKCGKCHSPSYVFDGLKDGKTPITHQPFDSAEIRRQVVRCTRLPHSSISKEQARAILAFLIQASEAKK